MADRPEREAGDPEPEAQSDGAGEHSVDDGKAARRTAEQDGLTERAVDRRVIARDVVRTVHHTSAPPPKLKKLRKKELAAKAIDRPNTIWISRRNPPEVSPKARLRPVTMMMITATILAKIGRASCRERGCQYV